MKFPKSVILLLVIILGIAFYWFSIRPSSIRKQCHQEAQKWSVQLVPFEKEPDVDKRGKLQDQVYEKQFESCLHKNGISK